MDERKQNEDALCYGEYQVVRGEFFSHATEPSFTFQNGRVFVNAACVKKMPDYDYVQILVHPKRKKLAIKPCPEEEKDSIRWCSATQKRSPRKIVCRVFFEKIYSLMGWNPDYRYKLLGKLMRSGKEWMYLFDLDSAEIYRKRKEGEHEEARNPDFSADWKSRFGFTEKEHCAAIKESVFQEPAVIKLEKDAVLGGYAWKENENI